MRQQSYQSVVEKLEQQKQASEQMLAQARRLLFLRAVYQEGFEALDMPFLEFLDNSPMAGDLPSLKETFFS